MSEMNESEVKAYCVGLYVLRKTRAVLGVLMTLNLFNLKDLHF